MSKRPKLVVLDTMNFWMDHYMQDLFTGTKKCRCFNNKRRRSKAAFRRIFLDKSSKKILKMGPRYLIIKKGEHGALLFNEKEIFFAPALH